MNFTFLPFIGKWISRLMLALFCHIETEWDELDGTFCPEARELIKQEREQSLRECSNPRDHERWPLCHKDARNTTNARLLWGPECPVHGPNAQVRFGSATVANERAAALPNGNGRCRYIHR